MLSSPCFLRYGSETIRGFLEYLDTEGGSVRVERADVILTG